MEGEVVVGLVSNLGSSLRRLGLLDLWVRLLDESEPTGQVGKPIASNEANGNLVGPKRLPNLGLDVGDAVTLEVRSESQVLVEVPQLGLNGAEVAPKLRRQQLELLVLHIDGVAQ